MLVILKELEDGNWIKDNISAATVIDSKLNTWLKFGIEHNDPFFVKFMTLWFAFNNEYNKFPGVGKNRYVDIEYMKIKEFCTENMDKLLTVYDLVFNSPFISSFKTNPIRDMKKRNTEPSSYQEKYFDDLLNGEAEEQTVAIFQMMYQVRCNLFHGGKSPDIERDLDLVRHSGEILEIYLKAIL